MSEGNPNWEDGGMFREVVYGPPGTGKTSTLTRIIEQESTRAHSVRVLSHTRAAAEEIAGRASRCQDGCQISFGTIHSFAFAAAGCRRQGVVDFIKLRDFERAVGIPTKGRRVMDGDTMEDIELGDEYLAVYGLSRSRLATPLAAYYTSHRPGTPQEFVYFVETYEDWKRNRGYYDFSDMLTMAVNKDLAQEVLVIDEAQDLSPAQWQLVEHWANLSARVYMAGDDDQAIYAWGGADPSGMHRHETAWINDGWDVRRKILDQSYRVPKTAWGLAQVIIDPVERVPKDYLPAPRPGQLERYSDFYDVKIDPDQSTLVLYRNHMMRAGVEEHLYRTAIPFVLDNGGIGPLQSDLAIVARAYDSEVAFDAASLEEKRAASKLLTDRDYEVWERGFIMPHDPLESRTAGRWNWNHPPYLRDLRQKYGHIPKPEDVKVHLSSIHGAKGREADHVVLINGVAGRSLAAWERDQDNERRVYYVAVTRTRDKLSIVQAENPLEIL